MIKKVFRGFVFLILAVSIVMNATAQKTTSGKKPKGIDQKQRIQNTALFIDGIREKHLGNFDKAAGLFAQCYLNDKTNDAALFEMAMLNFQNHKTDDALVMVKEAVKLKPENQWYQLLLARIYTEKKEFGTAIKIYKKLSEKNPESVELLFETAEIAILGEKYDDAIAIYNQIEKTQGIQPELSFKKEKIYEKQGKTDKAINELKKLIAEFPLESQYKGMLADFYMGQNMPDKAYELYQEILKADPNDTYVHLSLADYYASQNNPEKSIDELKHSLANKNIDVDTKVRLLMSILNLGNRNKNYKQALPELGKIFTETNSDEPKAFSIYGDILSDANRFSEARDAYRKVTTMDSSKFVIWQQLILLDYGLQDSASLAKESERAMSLFPEQPEPYYYYAISQMNKGNIADAITALNNCKNVLVNDNNLLLKVLTLLGDCYHIVNKYDLCYESYEKALKIDPNDLYVLNNYSYFLAEKNTHLNRAEELAERMISKSMDDFQRLDTYAWVCFRKKDYEKAKTWIEKAYQKGGDKDAVIVEHYGDVLFYNGDIEKAVELWNKALGMGSKSILLKKKIADKKYYE
jgi:tetratricopeptide (TPR) repeat protein